MFKLRLLLSGPAQSLERQQALVAALFRQPRSLMVSTVGSLVAACVCYERTGNSAFIWWAVACVAVLAFRMSVAHAFHSDPVGFRPHAWAALFLTGAVATAAIVGFGVSMTILWCRDLVAQLYMAANIISFTGGAAVRNNASPLAARSQTVIALGGPGLACLVSREPYLEVFALLILLHLIAQFEIITSLGRQTASLLAAEEKQAASNFRLIQACEQLKSANARLTQLSSTDGLTGLSNRRTFDAALQAAWILACRDFRPLALLIIDADHFKRFNDQHGHLAGDGALRVIANSISDALPRPDDCCARFGGEEFAVLLSEVDFPGALFVAETIRVAVSAAAIQGLSDERVTVSIGVASLLPQPEQDSSTLIVLADEALYAAKRNGRNRVEGARSSVYDLISGSSHSSNTLQIRGESTDSRHSTVVCAVSEEASNMSCATS